MNKIYQLLLIGLLVSEAPCQASSIDYVQNISPDKATELVKKGDELLRSIYTNQDPNSIDVISLLTQGTLKKTFTLKGKDLSILFKRSKADEEGKQARRDILAQVIAIVWKIYDMGGVKQSSSISYKVIDKDNKLYNFLKSYAEFANAQEAVFAYDRDPKKSKSTHYKEYSPEGQWGVDMRFFANQASLPLLPMGKKHLLFGKLVMDKNQPGLLFIKIEDSGIAVPSEIISHGLSFLKTKIRSKAELNETRSEKSLQPEILDKYTALISKLSPEDKKRFDVESTNSVRDIVLKSEQIALVKNELVTLRDDLMATLRNLYPNDGDNIKWRTGNEVIVDLKY